MDVNLAGAGTKHLGQVARGKGSTSKPSLAKLQEAEMCTWLPASRVRNLQAEWPRGRWIIAGVEAGLER